MDTEFNKSQQWIDTITESAIDASVLEQIETEIQDKETLSLPCAEVTMVAVESIAFRLGISLSSPFPALEAFQSNHTVEAATRISVETIKETLIEVWEKIKEAFKRVWEHLKRGFEHLREYFSGTKRHADSLEERVRALSIDRIEEISTEDDSNAYKLIHSHSHSLAKNVGYTTKPAKRNEIWADNIFDRFAIKGKFSQATIDEILNNYKELIDFTVKFVKDVEGPLNDIDHGIRNKVIKDEMILEIYGFIAKIMSRDKIFKYVIESENASGNEKVHSTGPLMEGKRFVYPTMAVEEIRVPKILDEIDYEQNQRFRCPIPVLSKQDMLKNIEKARELMERDHEISKNGYDLNTISQRFEQVLIKINQLVNHSKESEMNYLWKTLTILRKLLMQLFQSVTFLLSKVPSHVMKLSRAVLHYVDRSLSEYPV